MHHLFSYSAKVAKQPSGHYLRAVQRSIAKEHVWDPCEPVLKKSWNVLSESIECDKVSNEASREESCCEKPVPCTGIWWCVHGSVQWKWWRKQFYFWVSQRVRCCGILVSVNLIESQQQQLHNQQLQNLNNKCVCGVFITQRRKTQWLDMHDQYTLHTSDIQRFTDNQWFYNTHGHCSKCT